MDRPKGQYVPLSGVFESTLACNLNCKHCGSRAGKARKDELSTEECADLFIQLRALGMQDLTISGGEPTARPDWIDLIRLCANTGIRVGIVSNGIGLTVESARRAKDAGLKVFTFSLDGVGELHDEIRDRSGSFDGVSRAIEVCKVAGLSFGIVTHVNARNLRYLAEIHDYVFAAGAIGWQVQHGADMGNMNEHPELLLDEGGFARLERDLGRLVRDSENRVLVADNIGYFGPNERHLRKAIKSDCFTGCSAGIRTIGIESNGNIKGCLSIAPGNCEHGKDWVEGSIREEPLADIWFREGAFAYNREWTAKDASAKCQDCKHLIVCRGGCTSAIVAQQEKGKEIYCACTDGEKVGSDRPWTRTAAAALLATIMSATSPGCDMEEQVELYKGFTDDTDYGSDADTDTDTDVDSDTDVDVDTDTDTDLPDSGVDSGTDSGLK